MHPPPSPAWADFTFMIECTPQSGHSHSVYVLCGLPQPRYGQGFCVIFPVRLPVPLANRRPVTVSTVQHFLASSQPIRNQCYCKLPLNSRQYTLSPTYNLTLLWPYPLKYISSSQSCSFHAADLPFFSWLHVACFFKQKNDCRLGLFSLISS